MSSRVLGEAGLAYARAFQLKQPAPSVPSSSDGSRKLEKELLSIEAIGYTLASRFPHPVWAANTTFKGASGFDRGED